MADEAARALLAECPRELVKNGTPTDMQATWWCQKAGGNLYWRCEVPSRRLPGQALQLRFDDLQPSPEGMVMPRQLGDAAIWQFAANMTRGILMAAQRAAGYRVLLEVDDDYTISPPQVPNGSSQDWRVKIDKTNDRHTVEGHRKLAAMVDGIIVTTERLAERYRGYNEHVYVCPNSVAIEDWEEPVKPGDGILRIGYAASHSHWWDIAEIQRACSWAAQQPNVEIVLFGLDRWNFPHTQVPWTTDLAEYRRSLQMLDVGLCPLRSNAWADCKSDIKCLEYGMSGALPIPSLTEPYRPWWEWGGPVCETSKDFLKAVKWCVNNRDAIAPLAAKAKEYIVRERTIENAIHTWEQAVSDS